MNFNKKIFFAIIFTISCIVVTAQHTNNDTASTVKNDSLQQMNPSNQNEIAIEKVHNDSSKLFSRKNLVGGGFILNTAGILYSGYKWWWQGDYHSFSFKTDGLFNNYSYGVDKCGHFYTSYLYFNIVYNTMKWGGYSDRTSTRTAVFVPFLWALTIEVADGFTSYAFSPDDLLANSLGITYGLLQNKYPYLQNFKVKWSYCPMDVNRFIKHDLSISSDYDGHYYWLSCNMHEVLPKSLKKFWPKYLNLAAGYGALNVSEGSTEPKIRKFAIGLDYNLSAIPFKGNTIRTIFHMLDYFKFPAPAYRKVQFQKGEWKWFLLK
ncbi:MAG TPA: DUF2279 domain-containing protein [Bacteroidales bacterium]|nr:DUF2279 domain-containing protein [Bacteroidales bacterium]HPS18448.1 DUF2279 domain-containing protein [Bacteroidales bacterium]